MSRNVLHANRIFDSQTMALAFYPGLVDEYASIRGETYVAVEYDKDTLLHW